MKSKFYIICLCILCSCQPKSDLRGNLALIENMNKLVIGQTTAADVLQICGSPSLRKNDLVWIYATWKSEETAFKSIENKNQSVIRITFDNKGILKLIEPLKSSPNSSAR